jgi:hypothetical protein
MRSIVVAAVALLGAASASAEVPFFRATCPTNILAAGGGGTVFINGQQANVRETGPNAFTARGGGIQLDFLFAGGEPSLSYTGPGSANGMCTVTKFRPAAAAAGGASGGVSTGKMASECKGFASEKFRVRPTYVTVHPAFRDHGMYSMYGVADGKNFICTFNGEGKFVAVDATGNPDGNL